MTAADVSPVLRDDYMDAATGLGTPLHRRFTIKWRNYVPEADYGSQSGQLSRTPFRTNVRVADHPLRIPPTSLYAAKARGKQEVRRTLPEPVGSPPEHMPGLTRTPADEYVDVISDGDVLDAEGNGHVASKLARLENGFQVADEKTRRNDGFGRWIAIPAQPVRVRAADYFRQASTAAVKVDRGGLTGIAGQNANRGAVGRQRIANANHGASHLGPAELLVEVTVCRVSDPPPA